MCTKNALFTQNLYYKTSNINSSSNYVGEENAVNSEQVSSTSLSASSLQEKNCKCNNGPIFSHTHKTEQLRSNKAKNLYPLTNSQKRFKRFCYFKSMKLVAKFVKKKKQLPSTTKII